MKKITLLIALMLVATLSWVDLPHASAAIDNHLPFSIYHLPKTPPCADAIAQRAICDAASRHALDLINAGHFEAFIVVQDVASGAVVVAAASNPSQLDVH